MRIEVDFDLCEANAVCEHHAPEVFRVNDDDELEVLQPEPPDDLREKVQAAIVGCPRRALKIIDS